MVGGGEVGLQWAAVRLGFSGRREEKMRVKRRELGVLAESIWGKFSATGDRIATEAIAKIKNLLQLTYSVAIPS